MKSIFIIVFLVVSFDVFAQTKPVGKPAGQAASKPKLVVGIVVDQMRYDFLYRYWNKYSEGGFKKLVNEGFSCEQTHYNYVPTYTAPGHASIYTGTTPSVHGIISNNWYLRETNMMTYCAEDTVSSVGCTSASGKMSPQMLLTNTITDQLQLSDNNRPKVIGIALKDRGAILPAGHMADGAYWFDDASHNWVTSSYYIRQLPQWVNDFNAKDLPETYLNQEWNTLYPINKYTESTADSSPYEKLLFNKTSSTFPYNLAFAYKTTGNAGLIRSTPFGNTLTTDMAIATLEGERMGQGSATDFLCISYSSTDYVGHSFGPNAIETEDTYLRLDKDLERLLKYLDEHYGKGNVLVFLTADHGVTEIPSYLKEMKLPAGYINETGLRNNAKAFCFHTYGDSLILSFTNQQFFLNRNKIASLKLKLSEVQQSLADYLIALPPVYEAYTATQFSNNTYTRIPGCLFQNGFNTKRSGDVIVNYGGNILTEEDHSATSHGTPYTYDRHVPLLWYGWKIKHGETVKEVAITDIAVTLAQLLRIMEPTGATGKVIEDLFR